MPPLSSTQGACDLPEPREAGGGVVRVAGGLRWGGLTGWGVVGRVGGGALEEGEGPLALVVEVDYLRITEPSPIALLIGAGASRAFGMPTMVEFREQFETQLKPHEKRLWRVLIDVAARSRHISRKKVNIEHVVTRIEACEISFHKAVTIWRNLYSRKYVDPSFEEVRNLRQNLWMLRRRILRDVVAIYQAADADKVIACYAPIFSMLNKVSKQRLTNVFTVNYDLAFEVLANARPLEYETVDGFNAPSIIYQSYYVPQCKAEHSLILFKLHGSINWRYDSDFGNIQKTDGLLDYDVDNVVIVPPTAYKNFRQGSYSKPFNRAYSRLSNLFKQCSAVKILLVIGYGFADRELRHKIAEALAIEEEAAMIVVEPNLTKEQIMEYFPFSQ